MQVGDIYRFKPEFLATCQTWANGPRFPGHGPFRIIAVHNGTSCDVQSLENGSTHINWAASPAHWGNLDPFLTAAHKANEKNNL